MCIRFEVLKAVFFPGFYMELFGDRYQLSGGTLYLYLEDTLLHEDKGRRICQNVCTHVRKLHGIASKKILMTSRWEPKVSHFTRYLPRKAVSVCVTNLEIKPFMSTDWHTSGSANVRQLGCRCHLFVHGKSKLFTYWMTYSEYNWMFVRLQSFILSPSDRRNNQYMSQ